MVIVAFDPNFQKLFSKIKNTAVKERIIKQIQKIKNDPEIGKPMMYGRKDTRELYIPPYRISYLYLKQEDKVLIVDLYHKDEQ